MLDKDSTIFVDITNVSTMMSATTVYKEGVSDGCADKLSRNIPQYVVSPETRVLNVSLCLDKT